MTIILRLLFSGQVFELHSVEVNAAVGLTSERHSYFLVHQETADTVKIADILSLLLVFSRVKLEL
jgi:hypothetical protein